MESEKKLHRFPTVIFTRARTTPNHSHLQRPRLGGSGSHAGRTVEERARAPPLAAFRANHRPPIFNMSAGLVPQLMPRLTNLTYTDPDGVRTAVPPPVPAETAVKALRKMCESSASEAAAAAASGGSSEQTPALVAALLVNDDTMCPPRVLLAAAVTATDAIDAIERDASADTAECGCVMQKYIYSRATLPTPDDLARYVFDAPQAPSVGPPTHQRLAGAAPRRLE